MEHLCAFLAILSNFLKKIVGGMILRPLSYLLSPLLRLRTQLEHRICLCHCWQWLGMSPQFCHHFIDNVGVGLLITLLLLPFHHVPLMTAIEDAGIDWVIQRYRGTEQIKQTPPFVWLNIDENTYQQWDEPYFTPRDKLLKLIQTAVNGQAKVIIVDIELDYSIDRANPDNPHDKELKEYLANYCRGVTKNCPYLILVRTFRHLDTSERLEKRESFLEETVKDNPYILWASSLFLLENNNILRRWTFCQAAQTQQGESTIVLSLPILTQLLLQGSLSVDSFEECAQYSIKKSKNYLSNRILYRMPQTLGNDEKRPFISDGRPLLAVFPAHIITDNQKSVSVDALKESVTIIGTSYADSRDSYITPLGEMAGSLVIINAIHSLLQYGELHKPHWLIIVLIEIGLIFMMSLAFACFTSFYGMLFSGICIILIMLPLSFLYFQEGLWLDFALPLIAVQLHRMAAIFHQPHSAQSGAINEKSS